MEIGEISWSLVALEPSLTSLDGQLLALRPGTGQSAFTGLRHDEKLQILATQERTPVEEVEQTLAAAARDPVRVASATVTAGFVWWVTRSGGLVTTMLLGIPAWRHVDLLPVLSAAQARHEEDADDDEDGDSTRPDSDDMPFSDSDINPLFERHAGADDFDSTLQP
jgi:hypothetical protein